MNTINNIYKRLFKGKGIVCASLLASGLSLASCSDYLEILPLNEVVLENYWTKKDDVTSVLSGCYESLASEGCLDHMNVWGELRSENLVRGSNPDNKYSEILKENILPTNDLTKWEDLYTGAGVNGGQIVAAGTPAEVAKVKESLTGQYLAGTLKMDIPKKRRTGNGNFIKLNGVTEHNLKNVSIEIPLGTFTCITGVSGSGKSTLMSDVLYPALSNRIMRTNYDVGECEGV